MIKYVQIPLKERVKIKTLNLTNYKPKDFVYF